MELNIFGKGSIEKINKLEKQFKIKLPNDYRNFLLNNNGATVEDGFFYVKELKQEMPMGYFYGVDITEGYADIIEINKEYKDDLLKKSILIGTDEGEGWILLIFNGKNNGIWYYDHSYFFEQSTDDTNTYFICETFSEFMEILKNK